MIYYRNEKFDSGDSKIVAHIKGEFLDACNQDLVLEDDNIDDIAKAVELFIRDEMDCECINTDELVMLASRAMASVGEGRAARRFLLFGSGMARPSEWEVTTQDSMWILDLKQMTFRENDMLELVFFRALFMLIESIADVWDEDNGIGVLGLRHVCGAASSLLGGTVNRKNRDMLIDEIMYSCEDKLIQIGKKRGWIEEPRVMNLDIGA